jgi:CBS domain containing-hemolysin-like protein
MELQVVLDQKSDDTDEDPDSRNLATSTQPETKSQIVQLKKQQTPSLLNTIRNWLNPQKSSESSNLKETLEEIIEENEENEVLISPEEKNILQNIVSFGQLRVSDVMTPRVNITAVEESTSLDALRDIIVESEHTRIPVYRSTIDEVIGFIHSKDLVRHIGSSESFRLNDCIREIIVAPPSMFIIDLLAKMRKAGVHMALVVDEYGGTDGLVTMEDLVEQIVGDIQDEHDDEENDGHKIRHLGDGVLELDARMEIEELEEMLSAKLTGIDENEDFDTIGGLIFTIAGRVPEEGEVVNHPSGNFRFHILKADNRRIHRVRLVTASR